MRKLIAALASFLLANLSFAAFPTLLDTTTTTVTTAATTATLNLPSPNSGDLCILFYAADGSGAIAIDGAEETWTELFNLTNDGTGQVRLAVYYRIADGTEGATLNVTSFSSVRKVSAVRRYQAGTFDAAQAPEFVTAVSVSEGSSDIDVGQLTPTGGAKDYEFVWAAGVDRGDNVLTAAPTNYGDTGTVNMPGFAAGGVTLHYARRQLNASSDDPTAGTNDLSEQWVAGLIAVHPAAGGGEVLQVYTLQNLEAGVGAHKSQQLGGLLE